MGVRLQGHRYFLFLNYSLIFRNLFKDDQINVLLQFVVSERDLTNVAHRRQSSLIDKQKKHQLYYCEFRVNGNLFYLYGMSCYYKYYTYIKSTRKLLKIDLSSDVVFSKDMTKIYVYAVW